MRKLFGFTLAEVLVTLGIIGVVSAMTVPTLMQNYQRQSFVTQLHKVYNEMSQALLRYQTDRNALNFKEAGLNGEDAVADFVRNYFKVVQDCGATQTPCFPSTSTYHKLDGTTITAWYGKRHFALASGASIATFYRGDNNITSELVVDVNGFKGPNIAGRDLFMLYIYNTGEIDDLTGISPTDAVRDTAYSTYCQSNTPANYHGCFGKILKDNWEMTY